MKFNTKILSTDNVLLKNIGSIDPLKIDDYIAAGGYEALKKAVKMDRKEIIDVVSDSGLRGRGGANFPTGRKWLFTYNTQADQKYLVINADEGEPGTIKDRVLMEGDPHQIIEGMVIAAYAIGATKGFIYIRGEYSDSIKTMNAAIKQAEEKGMLGKNILNSGFDFEMSVAMGGGAYVCGEETALIDSMEGKRGEPRLKPPYPPVEGLFGKPTIVNNVETIVNVPHIIAKGGEWFRSLGASCSPGTKLFMLSGDVNEPGIVETPVDLSFEEVINKFGKGVTGGKVKFAQIGGSSGNIFTPEMLKKVWTYERCCEFKVSYGTGSIFVCNEERGIVDHLLTVAEFFEHESCGKCTPCREGTHRVREIMEKFAYGEGTVSDLELLNELCHVMKRSPICGLGQACVNPVLDAIEHYKNEILAN
ncbi:MAG TPA: NADH-quinone oxidoreductase subunit NuoF [bacterium]|nr:NADH-quinone oxidoreductase subunit NuoF [bacterium]HRQ70287.1 NADH-quinone oxidoreductase subunit NuoF [bacterium]